MPKCKDKYKDMAKFRRSRNRWRNDNYNQTVMPANEWTAWQNELILEHSMTDRELSKIVGHGVRAIQIQRCRLKKGRVNEDN